MTTLAASSLIAGWSCLSHKSYDMHDIMLALDKVHMLAGDANV